MLRLRISLALISLVITGCFTHVGAYRYVDVSRPAAAQRAAIESKAHELGYGIEHEHGRTPLMDDERPYNQIWLDLGFYPLDDQHSRVELSHGLARGNEAEISKLLVPENKDVVVEKSDELGEISEWLGIRGEASIGAGIGYDRLRGGRAASSTCPSPD